MVEDTDDFDPWESNPYGIRMMSPEEDAAWQCFEQHMRETRGYGWSIELDTSPSPQQRLMSRRIEAIGRAAGAAMQEFALGILAMDKG